MGREPVNTIDQAHASRMDEKYRWTRHLYDLTRRYFLLGREEGLDNLALKPGNRVLEIGCGTGRNIQKLLQEHPSIHVDGIDISQQMLQSARPRFEGDERVRLAIADAQDAHFGKALGAPQPYDAVLMSYSLSMIPHWQAALENALRAVKLGGRLSVVDFGRFEGYGALGQVAIRSLTAHQAPPVLGLEERARQISRAHPKWRVRWQSLHRGYAQTLVIEPR